MKWLVVAVVLVSAASAEAAIPHEKAIRHIAQSAYPLSCDLQITRVQRSEMPNAGAVSWPQDCWITIRDDLVDQWPVWFTCALVVHEQGHIAYLPDSHEQEGLMSADGPAYWHNAPVACQTLHLGQPPRCQIRRVVLRELLADARSELRRTGRSHRAVLKTRIADLRRRIRRCST